MKKRVLSFLMSMMLCISGVCAFAENDVQIETSDEEQLVILAPGETEPPENADTAEESAQEENSTPLESELPNPTMSASPAAATIDFVINMQKRPLVQDSFAKLAIYSKDGQLLDTQYEWVGGITEKIELHFTVPEYPAGESFRVKVVEGVNWVKYGEKQYKAGEEFVIETSLNDEGEVETKFEMSADPKYKKDIVMYNSNGMMTLAPKARLIDGITYVPVRAFCESFGLKVRYDEEYNSVAVSAGDKVVAYNIGSDITNYFGTDKKMNGTTRSIEGYVFVPVRSFADAFESELEVLDFDDHLDVIVGKSQIIEEYFDSLRVNQEGIGSKTNYLVWVSKHEYKVRVYEGQQYQWTPIAEFPCAIGAPDTPTITGQFDYISRETVWDYGYYYVGPIMRFYNGYALHSTLLYYDGTEYDGRVGVQISHGCVRLHPEDIDWMVYNIPLYSRIWVTE